MEGAHMKRSEFPKHLIINEDIWSVVFLNNFDGDQVGECCPSEMLIKIKNGQGADERLKTFLHEVVHAIEFSYNFQLNHKHVYKLEEGLVWFTLLACK